MKNNIFKNVCFSDKYFFSFFRSDTKYMSDDKSASLSYAGRDVLSFLYKTFFFTTIEKNKA